MKHTFRAAMAALLPLCVLSGAALVAQEPELALESEDIYIAPQPAAEDPLQAELPAKLPAGPVERYFLLLFDTPLGGARQLDEVTVAVEEWLGHELLPTDAAAVVSYYGQELLIAQDFTRDRQALSEAVGAAVRGQARTGAPAEEGVPSLLARLPQGPDLTRRTASFYGALQVLAETVDSVPGPKGLLVFSKGFGRAYQPSGFSGIMAGPELGISEEALAGSLVLEKYLPETSLYEPTLEALLSRQIRLYPVDLATDYNEAFPLAGVMSRLAAETGGRYVYPVTELPRALLHIAQTEAPAEDRLVEHQPLTPTAVRAE
jgi:hypothetical protein